MGKSVKKDNPRVLELKSMLDNYRYKLTKEQRIDLLEQIYDISLIHGLICAVSADPRFSSTAMLFLQRSREELDELAATKTESMEGIDIGFDPLVQLDEADATAEA